MLTKLGMKSLPKILQKSRDPFCWKEPELAFMLRWVSLSTHLHHSLLSSWSCFAEETKQFYKTIVRLKIHFTVWLLTSVEGEHPSRELEFVIVTWKRAVALLKPNGNPLVLKASRTKCKFLLAFTTDIGQKPLLNQKFERLFYLW